MEQSSGLSNIVVVLAVPDKDTVFLGRSVGMTFGITGGGKLFRKTITETYGVLLNKQENSDTQYNKFSLNQLFTSHSLFGTFRDASQFPGYA